MHGPGIMLTILQTHVGGFPSLGFRGTNLGVPRIRIVGFGGLDWGPLISGGYLMETRNVCKDHCHFKSVIPR